MEFHKEIWRTFKRMFLPKHIILHNGVIFNDKTQFGGNNVIHQGTCISSSMIGRNTYIDSNCDLPNSVIGSFCSLARNIKVIRFNHPSHTFVSTSPVFFSTLGQTNQTYVSENHFDEELTINGRSVIIGNDVWIGANAVVVGKINIGTDVLIAPNSFVNFDVPPHSVVVGNPAKIIHKENATEYYIENRV